MGGTAIKAWLAARPREGMRILREMYREWPFFQTLLSNMDMVLAKSNIAIASRYAELVEDTELIPEHDLEQVGLAAPEHEQVARERILPQHPLDQHGETVDALAHVGVAEGQVHLHARRKQRHGTHSSSAGATPDGAPASVICTATNIGGANSCFPRHRTRRAMP